MTLSETLIAGKIIGCVCASCIARTPLDPAFYMSRRGDVSIENLRARLVCGACGSHDVDLIAVEREKFVPRSPAIFSST